MAYGGRKCLFLAAAMLVLLFGTCFAEYGPDFGDEGLDHEQDGHPIEALLMRAAQGSWEEEVHAMQDMGESSLGLSDQTDRATKKRPFREEVPEWSFSTSFSEDPAAAPAVSGVMDTANPTMRGEPGTPGIAGPAGPQGAPGAPGPKGDRGMKGEPGAPGAPGTPGAPGAPGDVARGQPGPQGTPGAVGPQGVPGLPGMKGEQGFKGEPGPRGEMGPQGMPGPKGEQGFKGEPGPRGDVGLQGLQGPKGDQGFKGDIGPQGPPGPKGDVGIQGMPGPRGEMGQQGPPGPPGPMGLIGQQGPPGRSGVDGRFCVSGAKAYSYTLPVNAAATSVQRFVALGTSCPKSMTLGGSCKYVCKDAGNAQRVLLSETRQVALAPQDHSTTRVSDMPVFCKWDIAPAAKAAPATFECDFAVRTVCCGDVVEELATPLAGEIELNANAHKLAMISAWESDSHDVEGIQELQVKVAGAPSSVSR